MEENEDMGKENAKTDNNTGILYFLMFMMYAGPACH